MIIVQLAGGLGNQMFQYASALALARRRETALRLDASQFKTWRPPAGLEQFSRSFKLQNFNISAPEATPDEISDTLDLQKGWVLGRPLKTLGRRFLRRWFISCYDEPSLCFDPEFLALPDNVYLQGYWQSERYFKEIEATIRAEFTFRDQTVRARAIEYVEGIRGTAAPDQPVVAVHVRRGDLAHAAEALKQTTGVYGPPLPPRYFSDAMGRFHPESKFIVFTESAKDFEWCRQNIHAKHVYFCEGQTDLRDFATIQACDHVIMSNSTFSWWAAWLNPGTNKMIIAPRDWFFPGRYPPGRFSDLVPKQWELL